MTAMSCLALTGIGYIVLFLAAVVLLMWLGRDSR